METKEIKIASITRERPNLFRIRYKQLEEYPGVNEVTELVQEVLNMSGGKRVGFLSDFRDLYMNWEEEGKDYLSSHEELDKTRIATAILVNNLPTRLLIHGYLKMKKPRGIFEVFTDEKKARDWLNDQIEKDKNQ